MTFMDQVSNSSEWTQGSTQNISLQQAGRPIAPARRADLINRVVELEILPRLALARQATRQGPPLVDSDTTELVRLLLSTQEEQASEYVDRLVILGFGVSDLYLGIITSAARQLGELWADDRCTFAEVTIAAGRLQRIVRVLSPVFQEQGMAPSARAGTVLLLPAPREQHTLGVLILGEFFRRDGWNVLGGPMSTNSDTAAMVRDTWTDVAGFSIASTGLVEGLATLIRTVRRASRNRFIGVIVGGPLLLERPDLVGQLGADTTASDAPDAIRKARALMTVRSAVA